MVTRLSLEITASSSPVDRRLDCRWLERCTETTISTYSTIPFRQSTSKSLDTSSRSQPSHTHPSPEQIFFFLHRCILGKLHSKTCILVTHQIQFLKYATKIILLDKVRRMTASNEVSALVIFRAHKSLREPTLTYYEPVQRSCNGRKAPHDSCTRGQLRRTPRPVI